MRRIAFTFVLVISTLGFVAPSSANTLCADGTISYSVGSGTCSWHGGIAGGSSRSKSNSYSDPYGSSLGGSSSRSKSNSYSDPYGSSLGGSSSRSKSNSYSDPYGSSLGGSSLGNKSKGSGSSSLSCSYIDRSRGRC